MLAPVSDDPDFVMHLMRQLVVFHGLFAVLDAFDDHRQIEILRHSGQRPDHRPSGHGVDESRQVPVDLDAVGLKGHQPFE